MHVAEFAAGLAMIRKCYNPPPMTWPRTALRSHQLAPRLSTMRIFFGAISRGALVTA